MFYIGIDVAKNKHDITVLNQDGEVLFTLARVANSNAGASRFLAALTKHNVESKDCLVGMEPSLRLTFSGITWMYSGDTSRYSAKAPGFSNPIDRRCLHSWYLP